MRNPPHLLFFFFLLQLASGLQPPYSPTINITVNCGFSGNTFARDNRIWLGDINSDFGPFELQNNSSVISTAAKQPTEVDPIPYYTARLSYSEFTYMFSVTPGQLFIRLYFFPASYQNFDRSKALFSVKAGSYTLLSNFSAALTVDADALSLEGFSREFCVNIVENARFLNITFTPSPGNLDAYAFVNGIELVSMPSNLYYSEDISTEIKLIGQSTPYTIEKSQALETVYRLNIGGGMISPTEDTGMYRSWSGDDAAYLTSSEKGFVDRNTTIRLRFSKISNYTAPEEVYITALTMGPNKTINKSNNLTWEFSVDAGFNYLLIKYSLEGFSREFCVNIVENARFLNITFTPSPGNLDAYAFVNGIELVSMPSNLYYSEDISTEIKLIGQSTPYTIEKSQALETVYRLNIGGGMISPTEDTGMYRSWSGDDAAYLTSSEKGFVDRNTTIRLRFSKISNYTAPEEVYITALTMGPNKTINKSNNLTWEFSVDAGFNYLVRLHFCEFQVEVTKEGDRDFYIFIADQIAEERADVLSWSGGNGIPVYKD
nr:receptor-like protein kinase feronia [Quercus suber]